jgi:hypothetical protein
MSVGPGAGAGSAGAGRVSSVSSAPTAGASAEVAAGWLVVWAAAGPQAAVPSVSATAASASSPRRRVVDVFM